MLSSKFKMLMVIPLLTLTTTAVVGEVPYSRPRGL